MRIVCLAMIRSVHCDRHVNLLAEAGHEVHLLVILQFGDVVGELLPSVQLHLMPTALTRAVMPRPKEVRLKQRVREAVFTTLNARAHPVLPAAWPPEHRLPQNPPPPEEELPALDPTIVQDAAYFQPDPVAASRWAATLLDRLAPDLVHSFCIHQASYVAYLARSFCQRRFPVWMVSCWGYDIDFYRRRPHHQYGIRTVLETCDVFFPECQRDMKLARTFGYQGPSLAIDYIGAGWDLAHFRSLRAGGPTSQRRVIMVKGVESIVNRPLDSFAGLELAADVLRDYQIVVFGADNVNKKLFPAIMRRAGLKLDVLPRLPYDQLMTCMGQAKMSIATSSADGICTTALEALVMGSVPIQTNTSCLGEWIASGRSGMLVPDQDPAAVAAAIRFIVRNDRWVDEAVAINDRIADARLEKAGFRQRIVRMYEQAVWQRQHHQGVDPARMGEQTCAVLPLENERASTDGREPVLPVKNCLADA